MTSRERVMLSLSHKEPDRIPVDMGGGVSSLMKNSYTNLLKFLNRNSDDVQYSLFNTVLNIDEEILVKFGVDFRRIWLGEPVKNKIKIDKNDIIIDIFGIKRKIIGEYIEIVKPPLANADLSAVK